MGGGLRGGVVGGGKVGFEFGVVRGWVVGFVLVFDVEDGGCFGGWKVCLLGFDFGFFLGEV